ncbi:MAG: 3-deoxy-D-manno-octulosonic acid transferase, partial [Rhodobacterales bacterium]|nr:3-deoxy-D-manno-octulosonic acid transferase [Rhodobacterales bacterium]
LRGSRPPAASAPAPRARTLLAASTHEGEETPILQAFAAARAAGRFDHLILAPRHPARAEAVAALVARTGLGMARRSQGQVPGPDTPVHLADTLGEMPAWYAMAGATLVGGSLVPLGGHTPWEPAAQGSAILHGPHVQNFAAPYAALAAAGGAVAVTADTLAAALMAMDSAEQARLARAAQTALAGGADVAGLAARVLATVYPSG